MSAIVAGELEVNRGRLTLTRKVGQTIEIIAGEGFSITVSIQSVKGSNIRVNVQAPREFRVLRGELIHAKTDQGEGAGISSS